MLQKTNVLIALLGCSLALLFGCAPTSELSNCIYVDGSQAMLQVRPPFAYYRSIGLGSRVSFNYSDEQPNWQRCNAKWVKPFYKEGEYPVLVHRSNVTQMSVKGDICGPSPKFIIYDAPTLEHIYPGFYADGRLSTDPMAYRIIAALGVIRERCDSIPEELRFVALDNKHTQQGRVREVYFSGRVIPEIGLRLVSDNPDQEEAYWSAKEETFQANRLREQERAMRQAVGAILGMGIIAIANMHNSKRHYCEDTSKTWSEYYDCLSDN